MYEGYTQAAITWPYLKAEVYRFSFLVVSSELHQCPMGNWWLPGPSPFLRGRHFLMLCRHLCKSSNNWTELQYGRMKCQTCFQTLPLWHTSSSKDVFSPQTQLLAVHSSLIGYIPSIWTSSSALTLRLASCSSDVPLRLHMESISSMKIVVGA